MSKTERLIHCDEYTSPEWYYAQLADDWFCADVQGDYMVMRKMSECGYGETTAAQARLQSYGSIWELNKEQIKILLGKHYREDVFKDWETERQQPLEEYKQWLSRRA